MEIEISTEPSSRAVFELLGSNAANRGESLDLAPGVAIRYEGTLVRKGADLPEITKLVLTVAGSVGAGVVSNAVYDLLKRLTKPPIQLKIDRTEVEFEEGEIKRIVTERIERRS
jgi:hypothetical protein